MHGHASAELHRGEPGAVQFSSSTGRGGAIRFDSIIVGPRVRYGPQTRPRSPPVTVPTSVVKHEPFTTSRSRLRLGPGFDRRYEGGGSAQSGLCVRCRPRPLLATLRHHARNTRPEYFSYADTATFVNPAPRMLKMRPCMCRLRVRTGWRRGSSPAAGSTRRAARPRRAPSSTRSPGPPPAARARVRTRVGRACAHVPQLQCVWSRAHRTVHVCCCGGEGGHGSRMVARTWSGRRPRR